MDELDPESLTIVDGVDRALFDHSELEVFTSMKVHRTTQVIVPL